MPNEAFCAICPFFIKTLGSKMFCEAHFNDPDIEQSRIGIEFENTKQLNRFAKERCCTDGYFRCRVASVNFAMIAQRDHQHQIAKAYLGKKCVNSKSTYSRTNVKLKSSKKAHFNEEPN